MASIPPIVLVRKIEYLIEAAYGVTALESAVASLIAAGWTPLGGVSFAIDSCDVYTFVQAMTRESRMNSGIDNTPVLE